MNFKSVEKKLYCPKGECTFLTSYTYYNSVCLFFLFQRVTFIKHWSTPYCWNIYNLKQSYHIYYNYVFYIQYQRQSFKMYYSVCLTRYMYMYKLLIKLLLLLLLYYFMVHQIQTIISTQLVYTTCFSEGA